MKLTLFALLLTLSLSSCSQKPKTKQAVRNTPTVQTNTIAQGTFICWLNSLSSPGGRRVMGDMFVKGNTYGGDLLGKGTYTYDPASRIVRFNGGGFDQRKNGDEWIGIFYEKGAEFLDGGGGKAFNTMLIVTTKQDWDNGLKNAWIQQCELK